jgi:UDP-N-acetyl-D-mannosaminuronic acid transferase (WecB/TagA/CpsF family)
MNFIRDEWAVESCLQAIEASSPFRFCFLAIGCPQQEIIAQKLKQRGVARGLALCIGASINFITGVEKRAPRWMRTSGFEWLFRLLQNPKRLAKRYLVRGPRIFLLLPRLELRLRRPVAVPSAKPSVSSTQPMAVITSSHS